MFDFWGVLEMIAIAFAIFTGVLAAALAVIWRATRLRPGARRWVDRWLSAFGIKRPPQQPKRS